MAVDLINPAENAAQDVQSQQAQGPTAPPPLVTTANGAVVTPSIAVTPTNAVVTVTVGNGGGDSGTDAPVRTFRQTQISQGEGTRDRAENLVRVIEPGSAASGTQRINTETGELYDSGTLFAPTSPGVGQNDDNTVDFPTGDSTTVAGTVNTNSQQLIAAQPNVLDRFSSYTWRASVYLMTSDQVSTFFSNPKRSVAGYQLLFQSGGAPTNVSGFTGALNNPVSAAGTGLREPTVTGSVTGGGGRSPAFDLDFYIDSIELTSNILGKSTGAAHSQAQLKFTVTEPNGITLIDRIYQAVQDIAPLDEAGAVNYQAAHFLMVIRFYGYDSSGNLQTVGAVDPKTGLTDPNAVVEKFIPFKIRQVNWSLKSSIASYVFECGPLGQYIAAGSRRGTIPYDMSLAAGSVQEILSGAERYNNTLAANIAPGAATTNGSAERVDTATGQSYISAPPNAQSAKKANRNLSTGLMSALNEFILELTKGSNPVYSVADQYAIEFAPGAEDIRDAKLILPGSKKEAKLSGSGDRPGQNARAVLPQAQSYNPTVKTLSFVAGQPIVQVIDELIRNSSYIYNQQLTVIDAQSNEEIPNPQVLGRPVKWFQISFKAEPIGYDKLRNDYAYKITYRVSPYIINNYDSKYFPIGSFRGVHKTYPYWFTGQNTAVIEYQETLNTAYNQLVSGSNPQNSQMEQLRRAQANSMQDMIIYTYSPRSGQSGQQTSGRGTEPMANLADSLYTPDPNVNCKMRIIGDPAWIQQGTIGGGLSNANFTNRSFLPDGTINYDAEQVFFEVSWQRPADYNIYTGLAKTDSISQYPAKSRVYNAIKVVSQFRNGKFEQVVEGTLSYIPKPDGSNKAPGAPLPADARGRAEDNPGGVLRGVPTDGNVLGGGQRPGSVPVSGSTDSVVPAPAPMNSPAVAPDQTTNTQDSEPGAQSPPGPPTDGQGQSLTSQILSEPPNLGRFRFDAQPSATPPQLINRET